MVTFYKSVSENRLTYNKKKKIKEILETEMYIVPDLHTIIFPVQ